MVVGGANLLHENSTSGDIARYNTTKEKDRYYIPNCKLHNKPCVLLTTKKQNENYGRKFYKCKYP